MVHRIIDANGNRAVEGWRVLEDCARFTFNDAELSTRCKQQRHNLRQALGAAHRQHRDTAHDVGVDIRTDQEITRANLADIIGANASRIQEACRVLAEYGKLLGDAGLLTAADASRYSAYIIEQELIAHLPQSIFAQRKLYALVDTGSCDDVVTTAEAIARGGCGIIQLRAKGLNQPAYRDLAAACLDRLSQYNCVFVVNDHVAIAAALGAQAVHVGQNDLSPADAHKVLGPCVAIGLSTHTPEQVAAAQADPAVDYIGIGPMFSTETKPAEPVRGPQLLDTVRDELQLPSFAIGGLTTARLKELDLPHGAAVASALCGAADPEQATAELIELIE